MFLGDVSMPGGDKPLDQRLHLQDMLGRARLDRRRQAAERGYILVKLPVGFLRHPAARALILSSTSVMLRT